MGFWFFILFMVLIFPAIMIGFGKYFLKKAPSEINYIFGYRTAMSMKNEQTWEFAHKYCGRLWLIIGLILLPLAILVMLLVIGKSKDTIGTVGEVLCIVQLIPLVASIIPTEIALKKNFDKNGNRK